MTTGFNYYSLRRKCKTQGQWNTLGNRIHILQTFSNLDNFDMSAIKKSMNLMVLKNKPLC